MPPLPRLWFLSGLAALVLAGLARTGSADAGPAPAPATAAASRPAQAPPARDLRQDYERFRAALVRQASGPTGMYAIQDVAVIAAGASAHLSGASADALRWSDGPGNARAVRLSHRGGRALLQGPGLAETDLLKAPDQEQRLGNGLRVRATVYEDAVKAWLYNPRRVATHYKGLSFYPYDPKGVVQARFVRKPRPEGVSHLDSRNHTGLMYWVGDVELPLHGRTYRVRAFNRGADWSRIDHLLLFFTDATSGKTSYGGGRVLETHFPAGQPPQTLRLDLNTLYSFLCAHSEYYNCPIKLTTAVPVALAYGEKYPPGGE